MNTYDVGSLVPELAFANGTSSVGILLVAGREGQQALFDVRTFSYAPAGNAFANSSWMRPFYALGDSSE